MQAQPTAAQPTAAQPTAAQPTAAHEDVKYYVSLKPPIHDQFYLPLRVKVPTNIDKNIEHAIKILQAYEHNIGITVSEQNKPNQSSDGKHV